MRKFSRYSVVLFSILFGVTVLSHSARADYLIFKKKQCSLESSCLEPLSTSDPRAADLYQILINQTWPTSKEQPLDILDSERLQDALKSASLDAEYQFVWIPDTLQELHCAALLMGNHPGYGLVLDSRYHFNIPEYNTADFYAQTNEYLSHLIESTPKASRVDVDQFFDQLNEKGKKYYLFCNSEMGRFLMDQMNESGGKKGQITVPQINEFIMNKKSQQSLRAELAHRYNKEVFEFNQRARSPMIELTKEDEDPEQELMLDRSIQFELSQYKENKALIFRGTNGFETLEGGLAIDSAFATPPRAKSTRNKSLSYGGSLFSGVFRESSRDSDPQGGACPLHYMRAGVIGYAVSIEKDDPEVGMMFEIPRLGMIGRLFLSGEHFHPRSKVGTQDAQLSDQVSGIFPTGISSVKGLAQLGIIVNPEENSERLGHMIDEYLAQNAVVLSFKGRPAMSSQTVGFHAAQHDLAQRIYLPTSDFVERVSEVVAKNPTSNPIFNAAVVLLSRVKSTDERALGAVVDLLGSKDPNMRLLGVRVLGLIAPESPKVRRKIVDRLEDKEDRVVLAVIDALKNLAPLDEDTTDLILSSLDNADLERYHNAMIEVFVPRFLWTRDRITLDPKIQKSLARRIGACPNALALKNLESIDPKALKFIIKALGHDAPKVRIAALEVLESQPLTPDLFEEVTDRLEDKDSGVRAQAVRTLDKHHDQLPRITVIKLAQRMGDQEDYVRYNVENVFEHKNVLKSPAVVQELLKLFEHDDIKIRRFVVSFFKKIDPNLNLIPKSFRPQMKAYLEQNAEKKIRDSIQKKDFNHLIDELEDMEAKQKS